MNKRKYLLCFACLCAVSTIFIYGASLYGAVVKESPGPRADVIRIDAMKVFGELEQPAVLFLHDAHTSVLAKKNRDCTACHLSYEKNQIYPKFMRIKDNDRISVMNLYHKNCIGCHGRMKAAGEKAGPVRCEGCHTGKKSQFASSFQPMGFDASLHFRHSEAQDNKCERCHHLYDEKTKTLYYAKGREESCRYCHLAKTEGDTISMPLASHIACINCHRETLAKKQDSGPVTCAGCHDASAQQKIKKISPVPRMKRGQPDVVLLKAAPANAGSDLEKQNRMFLVPFDHQAHEAYNDTCRVCHHESLQPCNKCHTLAGDGKNGGGVNLETAMHRLGTDRSCIGCHKRRQKEANCAGCHALMGKSGKKGDASCQTCHMMPVAEAEKISDPASEKAMTSDMLKSRKLMTGTYPETDIPEKVIISQLSKKYDPVDFPHRKIVNALVNRIKDNKLAGYFHRDEGTVCKGCHHHSPASKQPPKCESCHGKRYDSENPLKPGIMGAYHQQCMGCHKEMGIRKPAGCTDCHKEKKTNHM